MRVVIDKKAGYCFGVRNAIGQAEAITTEEGALYSLGHIVHNYEEVKRLTGKGIKVIDHYAFSKLRDSKVLIRAHGEPPSTYETALRNNNMLIDATCPIVKHLQKKIRETHEMLAGEGQIVVYGKKGHPEVLGLLGQTDDQAIVVKTAEDVQAIDPDKDVHLFAQTTMDPDGFASIGSLVEAHLIHRADGSKPKLIEHKTICRQVSNRIAHLQEFASGFDLILFVSGKESSNGRFLFSVCRKANSRTFHIENADEIEASWLQGIESIGITGATSTPVQQLESIKHFLKKPDPTQNP